MRGPAPCVGSGGRRPKIKKNISSQFGDVTSMLTARIIQVDPSYVGAKPNFQRVESRGKKSDEICI
jgi:hypothetical protein